MRRILSGILSLTVFFLLQYGKIASYYFCKWQADQVESLKDCGCEIHLETVFGDQQHQDGIAPETFKEPLIELFSQNIISVPECTMVTSPSYFMDFNEAVLHGIPRTLFHPPCC